MAKYKNRKIEVNGILFDSRKEAKRYNELLLLEMAGAIQDLERQVKFLLIPAQYSKREKTKSGKPKCLERECAYIADFVYKLNGETVVEDTKGFRTTEYVIKRKLMLHEHGIRIKEI